MVHFYNPEIVVVTFVIFIALFQCWFLPHFAIFFSSPAQSSFVQMLSFAVLYMHIMFLLYSGPVLEKGHYILLCTVLHTVYSCNDNKNQSINCNL